MTSVVGYSGMASVLVLMTSKRILVCNRLDGEENSSARFHVMSNSELAERTCLLMYFCTDSVPSRPEIDGVVMEV